MADETGKEKIKSKKWFVGPLSKIGATILTALVGFYVYDTLGREIIEIANIEVRQLPIQIFIPKDLRENLTNDRVVINRFPTADKYRSTIESSFRDILRKLNNKIKRINDQISENTLKIAKISELTDLTNEDQIKILRDAAKRERVRVRTDLSTTHTKLLSKMSTDLNNKNESKKRSSDLMQQVVQLAYDQAVENERKYQIEVVLFNSGGKQAVVRYKGQLKMDETIVNLKKASKNNPKKANKIGKRHEEAFLENFVIVESKSFSGMTLIVDEYNNRKRDIEFSQQEYASGQQQAEIHIYDINDKKTRKKKFNFRNVLYEEEKESLKSILDKEYRAFK